MPESAFLMSYNAISALVSYVFCVLLFHTL